MYTESFWVTNKKQAKHKSKNLLLEKEGERPCGNKFSRTQENAHKFIEERSHAAGPLLGRVHSLVGAMCTPAG